MNFPRDVVEYILIAIALIGIAGGIRNRIKLNRRIGIRFIQYVGLTVLVPIIAVLSLESRISQKTLGAIAIAAVGGVMAGIGKDEKD